MIFAIYLLICGITLPIVLGVLLYKKIKERSLPGEVQRNIKQDEQSC